MSEAKLEERLKELGLDAPRLSPALIDKRVGNVQFHVFPGTTTTVCCVSLTNGFTVIGKSASVSVDNFNEEIGREVAFKDARDKIWELEGYLLRQTLHESE